MADPLQTNVENRDIPEYLRDYRAALMNAAFLSVFNEPYLRQQFPKGQFSQLPGQPPPTAAATDQPPSGGGGTPPDNTRTGESPDQQGIAAALQSSRSRLPNLLGMVYDPKTRTYIPEAYREIVTRGMSKGGMVEDSVIEKILKEYQELRENMPVGLTESLYDSQDKSKPDALTGAVTAPARKNPFGDLIGPAQTSLYTTGSSFGTALDRFNQPPDITSAPTPPIGTGVTAPPAPERFSPPSSPSTRPPSTGTSSYRPPSASSPSAPGASSYSPSGISGLTGSTQAVVPIYSPGLAGTTQAPAGYNPAQYATDAQAQGIAKILGGTTAATNVGGPNAPPSQNLINLGGSDAFNAGLVQQRLRAGQTPSEMTMSLQMMRDEVARSGGNTAEIDRMIEQNNRAYAAGAKTSPVGLGASSSASSSASNASSNPAPATRGSMASNDTPSRGGTGRLSTSSSGRSESSYEPPVYQPPVQDSYEPPVYQPPVESTFDDGVPDWLKELEQKPVVPYFGRGFASGGSLAQFDIGDDGKVRNYRKGGAIRKQTGGFSGPNPGGVGFASQPSMGGFQNLFAAANPNVNTSGIPNIFNPPPVYGQQRIMQFGTTQNPLEFGQYAPGVGFKASDMTLNALRGAGGLPSIFTPEGQISAGTDFGKGVRSINFATDIAGESAAAGRDFLGQTMASPEQQSYLMSLMPGIKEMGFKGPIKIDPLMAPTLQAPTGVTAANLKDYQMAEPMGVSGQNIDILGRLGGLNAAQVEGVPQVQQFQMQGPERVTGQNIDILGSLGGIQGARVDPIPSLERFQIAAPERVTGQTRDILGILGGLQSAQVQGVPQVQQFQMQGPERVTGQTRDILSALGDVSGFKVEGVPQVQQFQMGPAERVAAERTRVDAFGRPQAEQYMSPYMDAVTDVQKREASRQAAMQKAGRSAAAVRAGAFGGSRQAIQEGLAEEALQRQIGDIEAIGRQRAFENAQAQFERDRAASLASQQANVQSGLQAALANQQAGVTTGRENLGALLATQQLGTQAGLQAALANQQAAQQANLTKYGTRADILRSQSAQDLQAALANQQAGLMAGRENLGAQLATQQLGTQAGLQAALANQQAAQQAGLTQYGTRADILRSQSAQDLQAALANQQAAQTAARENLAANLTTQQLGSQQALQAALANQQAAQQANLTGYGTRADILRGQSAQNLQAALANQQAGLTAGRENLGAQLATQQLGTQTGLQAALANQQARQQAGLTQYGTTADILRGQSAQNLQAALANQQAGLTAGRENLAARLGTQQLAAQQALQAQLANQQAGLTAGQGNLQSALATQQLATQAGLEAAKASQSGDLATWQMQLDAIKQASAEQEAARQRGFQNRLAAMQQAQAGAAGLAGLGGTMMGIPGMAQQLELQRLAAMQQAGGAVDARTQQALDLAYQDFINQQNFPYQQMNFLQGILGGVPTGMQVEGVQFQRPAAGGLSGLVSAGAGSLLNYLNK